MRQRKLAGSVVCDGESHELADRRLRFPQRGKHLARPLAGRCAFGAASVVPAQVTADAADREEAIDQLLMNRGDLLAQLLGEVGMGRGVR